jgi:hypothetical protein
MPPKRGPTRRSGRLPRREPLPPDVQAIMNALLNAMPPPTRESQARTTVSKKKRHPKRKRR